MFSPLQHALRWLWLALLVGGLTGCASTLQTAKPATYASTLPRSIVVLPPLNHSPDVQASSSVLAQATAPLAEAGYYVIPVTLMTETFRQNGLEVPQDIHAIRPNKLRNIFGADAALYIEVHDYGARYDVLSSATTVKVQGRLVDLRSGSTLWRGEGQASNKVGSSYGGRDMGAQLVAALVTQVVSSVTDASHAVAGTATSRMLSPLSAQGMAYGPRAPKYRP